MTSRAHPSSPAEHAVPHAAGVERGDAVSVERPRQVEERLAHAEARLRILDETIDGMIREGKTPPVGALGQVMGLSWEIGHWRRTLERLRKGLDAQPATRETR